MTLKKKKKKLLGVTQTAISCLVIIFSFLMHRRFAVGSMHTGPVHIVWHIYRSLWRLKIYIMFLPFHFKHKCISLFFALDYKRTQGSYSKHKNQWIILSFFLLSHFYSYCAAAVLAEEYRCEAQNPVSSSISLWSQHRCCL